MKQLRLSEDAVLHMRRILDEFNYACDGDISRGSTRQRLYQLVFEFFDTFGSHVFRRPACCSFCLVKDNSQRRTRSWKPEGCSLYTKGGCLGTKGCKGWLRCHTDTTLTAEFAKT